MTRLLPVVVFLAGLAVPCWIGAGYISSSPVALAMSLLIGVVYLAGAWELYQYHRASVALVRALDSLSGPVQHLEEWLTRLPASLRNAARLRIQGEQVSLPGPAMAPYLVGLLVLLGMLGTFMGMVVTLRGTGLALADATDLQAIRASLATPVQGLGLAFGTSVAGVATSAMLGLLSALFRRERLVAVRQLDSGIATHLRAHTPAHQREESMRLLRQQADVMPAMAESLQALATMLERRTDVLAATLEQNGQTLAASLERRSQALGEQLVASQEAFHAKTQASYALLAASVDQSLKDGITEGARAAAAAIAPIAQTTMAGLARETAALHDTLTQALNRQMDGLSRQAQCSAQAVTDAWGQALTEQQRTSAALAEDLRVTLGDFAETLAQRSSAVLDDVAARFDGAAQAMSQAWEDALARQKQASQQLAADNQRALTDAARVMEEQAVALVRRVGQSHDQLRAQLAAQDEEKLSAWVARMADMATALQQEWRQASESAVQHQQRICQALEETATTVSDRIREQARDVMAQLQHLAQAVAQAPQAAADAVAVVRQKLSESMARDQAMLEERNRLLETLGTLLDAVNLASSEQRNAVDALVSTSADVLQRVGRQFTDAVQGETEKLTGVAEQVTQGAAQVTSLSEAFGEAVQLFGESNKALMAHLQRIEDALDKSLVRSDEQLAYYVAQAREVVDLSMLSQKQIIEELRQLGGRQAGNGGQA